MPAWLGQAFEACDDVAAVAENVAVLDDNVTDGDADAKLDAGLHSCVRIADVHLALRLSNRCHAVFATTVASLSARQIRFAVLTGKSGALQAGPQMHKSAVADLGSSSSKANRTVCPPTTRD